MMEVKQTTVEYTDLRVNTNGHHHTPIESNEDLDEMEKLLYSDSEGDDEPPTKITKKKNDCMEQENRKSEIQNMTEDELLNEESSDLLTTHILKTQRDQKLVDDKHPNLLETSKTDLNGSTNNFKSETAQKNAETIPSLDAPNTLAQLNVDISINCVTKCIVEKRKNDDMTTQADLLKLDGDLIEDINMVEENLKNDFDLKISDVNVEITNNSTELNVVNIDEELNNRTVNSITVFKEFSDDILDDISDNELENTSCNDDNAKIGKNNTESEKDLLHFFHDFGDGELDITSSEDTDIINISSNSENVLEYSSICKPKLSEIIASESKESDAQLELNSKISVISNLEFDGKLNSKNTQASVSCKMSEESHAQLDINLKCCASKSCEPCKISSPESKKCEDQLNIGSKLCAARTDKQCQNSDLESRGSDDQLDNDSKVCAKSCKNLDVDIDEKFTSNNADEISTLVKKELIADTLVQEPNIDVSELKIGPILTNEKKNSVSLEISSIEIDEKEEARHMVILDIALKNLENVNKKRGTENLGEEKCLTEEENSIGKGNENIAENKNATEVEENGTQPNLKENGKITEMEDFKDKQDVREKIDIEKENKVKKQGKELEDVVEMSLSQLNEIGLNSKINRKRTSSPLFTVIELDQSKKIKLSDDFKSVNSGDQSERTLPIGNSEDIVDEKMLEESKQQICDIPDLLIEKVTPNESESEDNDLLSENEKIGSIDDMHEELITQAIDIVESTEVINAEKNEQTEKGLTTELEEYDLLEPMPKSVTKSSSTLKFLKKFKNSFEKMSRNDLEELVLQKVVETIVHKSDYSELRAKTIRQGDLIQALSVKVAEVTKLYRDLEMVHSRVIRDLSIRNDGVCVPVKITRAVGLQVTQTSSGRKTDPKLEKLPSTSHTQLPSPAIVKNKTRTLQKFTPLRPALSESQQQQVQQETQLKQQELMVQQKQLHNQQQLQKQMHHLQQIANEKKKTVVVSQPNMLSAMSKVTSTTANRGRIPPVILRRSSSNNHVIASIATQKVVPAPSITPALVLTSASLSPSTSTQVAPTKVNTTSKNVIDLTNEETTESNRKQTSTILNAQPPALVAIPPQKIGNKKITFVINNNQQKVLSVAPNRVSLPKVSGSNNQYVQIASKPNFDMLHTLRRSVPIVRRHPAPLPNPINQMNNPMWKRVPPRPIIRIGNIEAGIVISWTMDDITEFHASIVSYQIYAYQETEATPATNTWRHVGDVKAMLLPMAVTLTQFQEGQRYHFAVRAVDEHSRVGVFSIPKTW